MKSMPIGHHGITGPGARLGALAALALGLLLLPAGAAAKEFTVNSSADPGNDGMCDAAECTLREAIAAAADVVNNPGPDDITFDLDEGDRVILLSAGQLLIDSDLTIDGDLDDDGTPDITVDDDSNDGVFVIAFASSAEATLEGLVITGGVGGGGIVNFHGGTLTVANSTISGNSAGDSGGGIANSGGTVTVANSAISGNSAELFGGGIANTETSFFVGTVTVTNSTISGNSATGFGTGFGGGIFNETGTLTVTDSTFSGNSANRGGGGILNDDDGTLSVTDSTISGNSAVFGDGGSIDNFQGTLEIKSTIVAGNTAGADCANFATLTSLGFNLDSDGTCEFTETSDHQNVPVADVLVTDANGPLLTDNGGPTQTIALLDTDTNPALDAIPLADCTVTVDQRGVSRPQPADGNCDIGAFELVQEAPVTIADLIELFDDAVAAGDLVGAGPGNSAAGRLNALRNMLLAAGDLLEQGDVDGACAQLQDAADRTDGASPPDDFVQGPAAPDLLDAITELQDELGCFA